MRSTHTHPVPLEKRCHTLNLGIDSWMEKGISALQTGDNGPHNGDMVDNIT
ncbi:hypothetical protein AA102526_0220 [Asaia lannensis NBRC 102526]|nr:hypothetical protein AA102526_0220 [Asaia lannensis NBRC 102526]